MKKVVLYLNLGTPDHPEKKAVKRYLKEFLMDPFVIDIPKWVRWPLVNLIIAPFRSGKSAHAYQSIWTKEGSPLLVNSKKLVEKLQAQLNLMAPGRYEVLLGMRYGQPSLKKMAEVIVSGGAQEVLLLPAYPQYALSSTETAFVEAENQLRAAGFKGRLQRLQDYYEDSRFVEAVAEKIEAVQKSFQPDHLLFSYHGLPKRHLTRLHPECSFNTCCLVPSEKNRKCYRHQSFMSTQALTKKMNLKTEDYSIGFQSRLGTGWIQPFSDEVVEELAKKGVKRLAVVCPSFTADCLETLEEISIRAKETFLEAGGEDLILVPCVNDSEKWAQGLAQMVKDEF